MKNSGFISCIVAAVVLFTCPVLHGFESHIPHITAGYSDWTDTLVVDNNSDAEQSFTLTLMADASVVYSQELTVTALGQRIIDLKALAQTAQTGRVTYQDKALQFRIGYENAGGGVAEFPLPDTLQATLGLYFSDYVQTIQHKGICVANMGDTAVSVTLYALGSASADPLDSSEILGSRMVSIAPFGKAIGSHSDFFPAVAFSQIKKVVAVGGAASLCGLTICGDADLSHLLFAPALPVTGFEPVSVITAKDIYYIPGDNFHKHTLDVYYPVDADGAKVLMFVPGGAWRQGDKDKYAELGRLFAAGYGYVVVVINYRLSNPDDGAAVHPDHVEDVAAAFLWTLTNIAAYGGSPSSVYLFGQSAGAHLVSLLCTDSRYLTAKGCSFSDIRGVIAMSGAFDLYDLAKYPMNPLSLSADEVLMYKAIFLDAFGGWDETTLDGASPSVYAALGQPPFMVIGTEVDMPGFNAQGVNFVSTLGGRGITAEYHQLLQSDYSAATWQTATDLAGAEPLFEDYIGHYAEVVAINPNDTNSPPTTWIVNFMAAH
ncbi:MAG: alpha/beta hydrolase [Pseudomonadota bacterium]